MTTVPIAEFKSHLSEIVEATERTQDHVTITRHGRASVVLLSADEYAVIEETLFWAAQPKISNELAQANAELAAGEWVTPAEARNQLGIPPS